MSGKRGSSSGDPSKRERKKQRTEQTRQKIKEAVDLFFGSPDYRRLNKSRGLRAPLVDLFREKERLRGKYLNEIPSPGASVEYELSENGEIFLEFLEEKIREEWQTAKFINLDSSDESEDDVVFVREEMRKPEPRPANRAGRQSESDDDDGKQPVVEPKRRTRAAPTNANPSLLYFGLKWLREGQRLPENLKDSLAAVANVENAAFAKEWDKTRRQANAQRKIDGGTVTVNTFETRNPELAARLDAIGVRIPTRNAEKEQGPPELRGELSDALVERFKNDERYAPDFFSTWTKPEREEILRQWLLDTDTVLGEAPDADPVAKLLMSALGDLSLSAWMEYYILRYIPFFDEAQLDNYQYGEIPFAIARALDIFDQRTIEEAITACLANVNARWDEVAPEWPALVAKVDRWASNIYPQQFPPLTAIRALGDRDLSGAATDSDRAIVEYFQLKYMVSDDTGTVQAGGAKWYMSQGLTMLRLYMLNMKKRPFEDLLKTSRDALNAWLASDSGDATRLLDLDFTDCPLAAAEEPTDAHLPREEKRQLAKVNRDAARMDQRICALEMFLGNFFDDEMRYYLDDICGAMFKGDFEDEDAEEAGLVDDTVGGEVGDYEGSVDDLGPLIEAYRIFIKSVSKWAAEMDDNETRGAYVLDLLERYRQDPSGAIATLGAKSGYENDTTAIAEIDKWLPGLQTSVFDTINIVQNSFGAQIRSLGDQKVSLVAQEKRAQDNDKKHKIARQINEIDKTQSAVAVAQAEVAGVLPPDDKIFHVVGQWNVMLQSTYKIDELKAVHATALAAIKKANRDAEDDMEGESAQDLLTQISDDVFFDLLTVPPLAILLSYYAPAPDLSFLEPKAPAPEPVRRTERARVVPDDLDAMLSDEVWSSGHGRRRVPIGAWRKPQVSLPKVGKREVLPVPPWRRNLPAASATVAPWQWVLYFLLLVGTADIPDVVYDKVAWRLYIDDPDEKAAALAAAQDAARLVFAENDGGFARSFARLVFQRPEDKKISGAMRELSGHDPSEDDMVVTSRNPPAAESRQAEPDSPPPAPRPRGARIAPVDLDADVAAALILSHGDLEDAFALLNIQ